jgi:hypothetical protein
MTGIIVIDVQLSPQTEVDTFEKAALEHILPAVALYRAEGEGFPPSYRCVLVADALSDSERGRLRSGFDDLAGAHSTIRTVAQTGVLPSEDVARADLRSQPGLFAVTIRLPDGEDRQRFENQLVAGLADEVAIGSTRVNYVHAAFWSRPTQSSPTYECLLVGAFMMARLRIGTQERIGDAGAEITQSLLFRRVIEVG